MIDLTPLEVRQKKGDFRRALRGYDPELVNDFLDLVADRLEDLVKENMALRESAAAAKDELTGYRHKEQALGDALMAAQKLRDETREQAEREGDLLLREARQAAQAVREEAARQVVREEEALRQVRARRAQLVESFRRLLEREMTQLSVIEESLELGSSRSLSAKEHPTGDATTARPKARDEEQRSEEPEPEPEDEAASESEERRDEAGGADEFQDDWLSSLTEE